MNSASVVQRLWWYSWWRSSGEKQRLLCREWFMVVVIDFYAFIKFCFCIIPKSCNLLLINKTMFLRESVFVWG